MFREQLRRKPGETQKKEMKKKKEGSDATVKVPAATLGDARVLALWLDERGKNILLKHAESATKVRLAQKNQAPAHLQVLDFQLVWMTGLEPATSWSLTRCATNCATSRESLGPQMYCFFLNMQNYF